jgi:hypothetical protein
MRVLRKVIPPPPRDDDAAARHALGLVVDPQLREHAATAVGEPHRSFAAVDREVLEDRIVAMLERQRGALRVPGRVGGRREEHEAAKHGIDETRVVGAPEGDDGSLGRWPRSPQADPD